MRKVIVTIFFCLALLISGISQEFALEEKSIQDPRHYHLNQVWMMELSLKEFKLRKLIEFDKDYDFEAEFEELSKKLNATIPASFWKSESRPVLGDSLPKIKSDENFVRWTYGKMQEDKKIIFYGQLVVYFSDGSLSATVTRVVFKRLNEFVAPDSEKIIEMYNNFKAERLRNPPPPLPPSIRGN